MRIYEIGTGYTPIPAQVAAATENVVEELTKAFLKMGVSVEIIDISAKNRAKNDLPIHEVVVPAFLTGHDVSLGIAHKIKRVVYSIALASKLKKMLKNENEKVILHFHNQYNLFFFLKLVPQSLRNKARIAYTNHNGIWSLDWDEVEPILKKKYFQEIFAMKNADLIFALNLSMKKNIIDHLRLEPEKVLSIDNGVNTDIYSPLSTDQVERIKSKYGLDGKRIILQVGSINDNKGQQRAVKILEPLLKKNDSLVYAYAGGIVSSEYHSDVKKTAKELGVEKQVVYLGAVSPGREMNELYNLSSATIFLSKYEGFPLVCIESMAAGSVVILCSDIALKLGEACFECNAKTVHDTIERVLDSDPQELQELARNNAEKNYTWSKIAVDYKDVFESQLK